MHEWSDFFVAITGASAALTGLIFVGVSISLDKILAIARLPSRAFEALLLLVTVLVVSGLALVPAQSACLFGIEVLLIGILLWAYVLKTDINIYHATDKEYKKRYLLILMLTQLSVIPYIIGGIVLICQSYNGLYWLVPGIMISFIKAVIDAWVLLVEIRR
ncbi:MAG TPA: hypothetical protein VK783_13095 [Bacteroidia bacterium]|nr:hypothetical protein [Bacteroidia bacterium]